MNPTVKIAVIGGTGKAGKYLVKQLIAQGYTIKLLHRNPDTLAPHPLITIVKGDARDHKAIMDLVTGCDAVISCLGQPVGEVSIFSDATKNVLAAMATNNIRRYILITGLNVDTPFDKKSGQTEMGTQWMKEHYPKTTADKQFEYELLTKINVDWTLVRLPLITQTDDTCKIDISLVDCPGRHISATNLALFLIGQLADRSYLKQAPFIADV